MSRPQHRRRDTGAFETRPFREGDDESWIDWGLTASSGRMMVRVPVGREHTGPEPDHAPRVNPKLLIAGATGVAVVSLVAGIVVKSGGSDDGASTPRVTATTSTGVPPRTTTTSERPGTTPTGPRSLKNLVLNPSFEAGTAGWSSWRGRLTRADARFAPKGRHVARVVGLSGNAFTLNQNAPAEVDGWASGSRLGAKAFVRAANAEGVGKVVLLRLRQRTTDGRLVAETASRPMRLTRQFTQITVQSRLRRAGSVVDVRVSAESGWFKTKIRPGAGFEADAIGLVVRPARS